MKLIRISDASERPCDKAIYQKYIRVDERNASAPDRIPAYLDKPTDWWYKEGTNHRVEDGHIKRDVESSDWFLEINDFEELSRYMKLYGWSLDLDGDRPGEFVLSRRY